MKTIYLVNQENQQALSLAKKLGQPLINHEIIEVTRAELKAFYSDDFSTITIDEGCNPVSEKIGAVPYKEATK